MELPNGYEADPGLFCRHNLVTIDFVVYPEKATLNKSDNSIASVIYDNGGWILKKPGQYGISLVDKTLVNPVEFSRLAAKQDLFKHTFVYDCIREKRVVDLNQYRLTDEVHANYNANDVLYKKVAWEQINLKRIVSAQRSLGTSVTQNWVHLPAAVSLDVPSSVLNADAETIVCVEDENYVMENIENDDSSDDSDSTEIIMNPVWNKPIAKVQMTSNKPPLRFVPHMPVKKSKIEANENIHLPTSISSKASAVFEQAIDEAPLCCLQSTEPASASRQENKQRHKWLTYANSIRAFKNRKIQPDSAAAAASNSIRRHRRPPSGQVRAVSPIHDICENDFAASKSLAPRVKKVPYSIEEGQTLLNIIIEQNWYGNYSGNMIYKWIESKGVFRDNGRTYHSLRNHFIHSIIPHFEKYQITLKQRRAFEEGAKLIQAGRKQVARSPNWSQ